MENAQDKRSPLHDYDHKISNSIHVLKRQPYRIKHPETLRYIRQNLVPRLGLADSPEGELMRELDALRREAQREHNIKWSEAYAGHCRYIRDTLCALPCLSDYDKERAAVIMDYIYDCGEYTARVNRGEIPRDEVNSRYLPYTRDNLYDMIADMICIMHTEAPKSGTADGDTPAQANTQQQG